MNSLPSNSLTAPGHALRHTRASVIDDLPLELSLQILEDLPQDDLRAFSESSKSSYGLALQAGLYIPRTVRWTSTRGFGESLTTLNDVLDHAESIRPALKLLVTASFARPERGKRPVSVDAVLRLLASIGRAFPFLFRLDLSLPPVAPAAAVSTLLSSHAAPRLHTFALDLSGGGIPGNLFNGHAPKLRTLLLDVPDIGILAAPAPVTALRNVTQLLLSLKTVAGSLKIADQFPALGVLGVKSSGGSQTTKIDISDLRLRRLTVKGDNVLLTGTSDIPLVEHHSDRISSFWQAGLDSVELYARAECESGYKATITLAPRDGVWRRTLAMTQDSDHGAALPLADAPMLSSSLVSLTLAITLVNALVQTPVELRALRELLLDLTMEHCACWPPTVPEQLGLRVDFADLPSALLRVRCPALTHIVIFAVPSEYPIAVRPNKVTRLAHALGLRDQQAALTLAGCTFFTEPVWPLFQRVFSGVAVVRDAEAYIPTYYHTCKYSRVFEEPEWHIDRDG